MYGIGLVWVGFKPTRTGVNAGFMILDSVPKVLPQETKSEGLTCVQTWLSVIFMDHTSK